MCLQDTRDIILPQLEEVRDSFYGVIGIVMIGL